MSGLLLATACSHKETAQMAEPLPPPPHQTASIMDSIILEPGAIYNGCHVTKSVQVNSGWDVNPQFCSGGTGIFIPSFTATPVENHDRGNNS